MGRSERAISTAPAPSYIGFARRNNTARTSVPTEKEAAIKTFNIRRDRRDYDPAKLRTWVGICTLTAAAYAAILLFSPVDQQQAQHHVAAATAPATPPIASGPNPSVPPAAQALAGVAVDTAEPAPTF